MELKAGMQGGVEFGGKKFVNYTADEITRNVVRAVVPSFIRVPPMPMHRSPRSEVIRGRLTINNYMPHLYMFAHEDGDGYVAGIAEKGLNYAGTSYGGQMSIVYILVPKGLPDAAAEELLKIGLLTEGKAGGEVKQALKKIKAGEIVVTLWDPITNFRTATLFDRMKNVKPEYVAKLAQTMLEKVPDPRVKAQERLPLPVPKIGQEYMERLNPEQMKLAKVGGLRNPGERGAGEGGDFGRAQ